MNDRSRLTWKNVLIANGAVLAVALFLLELATLMFMPHNQTFRERRETGVRYESSAYSQFFAVPNQVVYQLDGGRLTDRVAYRFNRFGYRGPDFEVDPGRDEIRIAILGGSHVFDLYSYEADGNPGFPQLIEDALIEAGYRARVLNGGLPGNNTRHLLARLAFDVPRYEPNIVIVNSIWNDLKWISRMSDSTLVLRTSQKASDKNPLFEKVNFLDTALGWSAVYRKLRDYYWKRVLGVDERYDEGIIENPTSEIKSFSRGLGEYRRNLVNTVHLTRAFGATPVFAIEERFVSKSNSLEDKRKLEYHYVNIDSHDELVDLFERCESIMRSIGDSLGVHVFDVNEEMEGKADFFFDHIHTTPEGSRYMAERYAQLLGPLIDTISERPN